MQKSEMGTEKFDPRIGLVYQLNGLLSKISGYKNNRRPIKFIE